MKRHSHRILNSRCAWRERQICDTRNRSSSGLGGRRNKTWLRRRTILSSTRASAIARLPVSARASTAGGVGHPQVGFAAVVLRIAENRDGAAPILRNEQIAVRRPLHPPNSRQAFLINTDVESPGNL